VGLFVLKQKEFWKAPKTKYFGIGDELLQQSHLICFGFFIIIVCMTKTPLTNSEFGLVRFFWLAGF